MSITNDFHLWKSDFFGNPYIDPYIVYRLSGSEFSLLKNFFYTQTQIIGKFIYGFPKKNLISIYGNHGVIDMKNNKQLVTKQQAACYKTTSSLLQNNK